MCAPCCTFHISPLDDCGGSKGFFPMNSNPGLSEIKIKIRGWDNHPKPVTTPVFRQTENPVFWLFSAISAKMRFFFFAFIARFPPLPRCAPPVWGPGFAGVASQIPGRDGPSGNYFFRLRLRGPFSFAAPGLVPPRGIGRCFVRGLFARRATLGARAPATPPFLFPARRIAAPA